MVPVRQSDLHAWVVPSFSCCLPSVTWPHHPSLRSCTRSIRSIPLLTGFLLFSPLPRTGSALQAHGTESRPLLLVEERQAGGGAGGHRPRHHPHHRAAGHRRHSHRKPRASHRHPHHQTLSPQQHSDSWYMDEAHTSQLHTVMYRLLKITLLWRNIWHFSFLLIRFFFDISCLSPSSCDKGASPSYL